MALSAGTPISAKNAKVRINWLYNNANSPGVAASSNKSSPAQAGTALWKSNWTVTTTSPKEDTSNFEEVGYTDKIGTLKDASFTVSGFFDAGQNEFDTPPQLQPDMQFFQTTQGGGLALFLKDLDGPYWFFPNWYLEEAKVTVDVHGIVQFEFTGHNKGQFYYPSGQPSSAF
jgi:hypothetical protein